MEGSQGAAEVAHHERPGHCSTQSLSWNRSPRIEGIMERSWGLAPCSRVRVPEESPGQATGRCSYSGDPQNFGGVHTVGWLPRKAEAVEKSQPEPRRQAVCVFCGWPPKPFGTQRITSEPLESHPGLHTDGAWFCFGLIATVSPILPSGSKKACNLFYRTPQFKDFGVLESLQNFAGNLEF